MFLALLVYAGIVACALWSAAFFSRLLGVAAPEGRIGSIDGLRGFLALGVFAHHFVLWQDVFRGGSWSEGAGLSLFENQLGWVGVSFFFMITAFLFTRKVVFRPSVDWGGLYLGRIFRIYPLYLVVLALVTLMAFHLGAGNQTSLGDLLRALGDWVLFYHVPIDGYAETYRLVAGVVWTLGHEMVFYLCLPLLALAHLRRVPVWTLLLPMLAVTYVHFYDLPLRPFAGFLFGILAAYLVEWERFRALARHRLADLVVASVIALALFAPRQEWVVYVGIAFCLVAGGATLWGTLTARVTRTLGEVTYSLYLLHGIVLSGLFYFAFGLEQAATIPAGIYELLVIPITFVLVGASFWTFKYVERPGMQLVRRLRSRRRGGEVLP